jgi:hypothetical protein
MSESTTSPSRGRQQSTPKRTKLKGPQLERKRKLDREAQAALRNRTKNRIAHLESLVKALGKSDHQDEQLLAQLNGNREQIERLVDTLASIRKLVNSALDSSANATRHDSSASLTCAPPPGLTSAVFEESSDTRTQGGLLDDDAMELLIDAMDDSHHNTVATTLNYGCLSPVQDTLNYQNLSMSLEALPTADFGLPSATEIDALCHFDSMHSDFSPVPAEQTLSLTEALQQESLMVRRSSPVSQESRPDGTLWYLVDRLMNQAILHRSHVLNQDAESEDIPIRAILNGWPVVEELYSLDSGWKMLRECDQTLFAHCGALERLAILRMMRLIYIHQIEPQHMPQSLIPKFMVARPSERHMAHQRIVEYFVWPGLREHIIFSPRRYAVNRFMDTFRNSFRFLWPFDLSDAFAKNKMTGLYSFTPRFVEGQGFLRCWTMHADFFRQFPELKRDMPIYDSSRSLTGTYLAPTYLIGAEECLDELGEEESAESIMQGTTTSIRSEWTTDALGWFGEGMR